jgi:unsaturated chondroitin disaccharide hydrolase
MSKRVLFIIAIIATNIGLFAQTNPSVTLKKQIAANLSLAVEQYQILHRNVPANRMPQNFDINTGQMVTSNTKWWCAGFFPGTLWYLYEYSKNTNIQKIAEERLNLMEPEKHFTGNHDLGFMMYCSYGNAYRITKNDKYKKILDTAAMSLASRFRPKIQSIQSWDSSKNFKCAVIVDNMMNLELLTWVSNNGGNPRFGEIARTHANTTIERQFRPDNAAYHVLDYSLATGTLLKKTTWQGYSDSSAWARGQGWAVYGYTMMYRLTKDEKYKAQANKIAAFILNHPRYPKDGIPYWDFDAPNIPNALRDASAGAIMASAFIELSGYVTGTLQQKYKKAAETILTSLSSPEYLAAKGTNGGFLLKHSVGALPLKGEVDMALTYADYYFVEAMLRYLKQY